MAPDYKKVTIQSIKTNINFHRNHIIGTKKNKEAAVIIPLIIINNEINVLFEVRSKNLKSQPGDVCFPGGKIDKNEEAKDAALREIDEELGIKDIKEIRELDTFVRYDGLIIYPYLGLLSSDALITLNSFEVDHTFFVPLQFFINNKPDCYEGKIAVSKSEDFPYDRINGNEKYKFAEGIYNTYFYKYNKYNIWGVTAAIMYNFIQIISK